MSLASKALAGWFCIGGFQDVFPLSLLCTMGGRRDKSTEAIHFSKYFIMYFCPPL